MKNKKILSLFLAAIMLMSFSTMFVSANTRSINYPQSWVNVGETIQLSVSSGFTDVDWFSSNPAVAAADSRTGEVTGVSSGIATISANCQYASGSSETYTTYITVYDNRGIVNGEEYYILNAEYDNLLSLASASTANNTDINLSARSTLTTKQWRLTQQSTGMYTIASVYASSSMGLYVNSSANDVSLYTLLGSSRTHFEIRRINESPYDGLYLICYGSKYLAATSSTTVALTSTLNSKCYWSLSRVEKQIAELDAFSYMWEGIAGGGINTTKHVSKFNTEMDLYGYTGNFFVNRKVANTYNDLPNCSIFVFNGHSDPGKLYYYDSDTETLTGLIRATTGVGSSGYTSVYTISNLDANELANMQCALLLGCSTANDVGVYNILDEIFNKGAHFVLGTTQSVDVDDSDNFLEGFLDGVSANEDVYACYRSGLDMANNCELGNGLFGYYPAVFIGDSDQYLS
ncbi:MAG: Ig-like domain-containing protein [Clostridia bacterium]|nr:Ig-like domain-containing protein [Clostridia bacterium]